MRAPPNPALAQGAQQRGTSILRHIQDQPLEGLSFVPVTDPTWRRLFDACLDAYHYAGGCQRVGRCLRLALVHDDVWVGGSVIGSPFPNILVRDEALGMRRFVTDWYKRGKSPWTRHNREYWQALQGIIDHARTFVFPTCQGQGYGTRAIALLESVALDLWYERYRERPWALDTLCHTKDGGLFRANGWDFVGHTRGYTSSRKVTFSRRDDYTPQVRGHNVGLVRAEREPWCVWVKALRSVDDYLAEVRR